MNLKTGLLLATVALGVNECNDYRNNNLQDWENSNVKVAVKASECVNSFQGCKLEVCI